jgi:hypothetical protein
MRGINAGTVEELKLKAPRASSEDTASIRKAMDSETFFPLVKDPLKRKKIFENISLIPHLIPTLESFCEDTKYLEAITKPMRLLVQIQKKETLEQAFLRIYKRPNREQGQFIQQDSEKSFIDVQGREAMRFKHSFLQLILKCMRGWPEMVNISCRKDESLAKPIITEPNAITIRWFATLAFHLGFDSDPIRNILSNNPDIQEMRICLGRLEPDNEDVDDASLEAEAQELLQLRKEQRSRRPNAEPPLSEAPPLTTEGCLRGFLASDNSVTGRYR